MTTKGDVSMRQAYLKREHQNVYTYTWLPIALAVRPGDKVYAIKGHNYEVVEIYGHVEAFPNDKVRIQWRKSV